MGNNQNSFWYLENIDVIFCPKKVGNITDDSYITKEFKKGEYIYWPEDISNKIFFITKGRVKIGAYSDSGKEITKAIIGTGEVFGELALTGEEKRRDFAYVMDNVSVCVVELAEMKSLVKDHNGLNMFLLKIMGSRLLKMESRLESLVFKDSRTRIVEFIIDYVNEKGERVGYEMVVRKFITHQEIANMTATSRQTVTTTLNELRNDKILTFDRKRLLIRDFDKLKAEIV